MPGSYGKAQKLGKGGRCSDPDHVQHTAKLNPAFQRHLRGVCDLFFYTTLS